MDGIPNSARDKLGFDMFGESNTGIRSNQKSTRTPTISLLACKRAQIMPSNVLSIPLKVSSLGSSAFSRALRSHIAESFTDTHPDAFTDDLKEVAVLRERVAHMDIHLASVEAALRWV